MNYNMKEIARLAGVSQPTVSRVINGNPKVNPELKKKVLEVIESVGYQPNKAAQTLKNSSSYIIGVSVTSISNPYFMDLIEAIEYEARQIGYNILLHNCENNVLTEQDNIKNFIARQVDGVIIVPESHDNLDVLTKMKIPTVVITQDSDTYNSITITHEKGGALAAEAFIQKSCSEFLYIGQGPLGKDLKQKGYTSALHAEGLDFKDINYIHHPSEQNNSLELEAEIINYLDSYKDIFSHKKDQPTVGILCGNDIIAIQFITIAARYGLTLHKDYVLIGFDDTILAKSYRFSSIRQPIKEMSTDAIRLLMELIGGNITSVNAIALDPVLITRD